MHEAATSTSKRKRKQAAKLPKYVPVGESAQDRDRRTIFVGNLPVEVIKSKVSLSNILYGRKLISPSQPNPNSAHTSSPLPLRPRSSLSVSVPSRSQPRRTEYPTLPMKTTRPSVPNGRNFVQQHGEPSRTSWRAGTSGIRKRPTRPRALSTPRASVKSPTSSKTFIPSSMRATPMSSLRTRTRTARPMSRRCSTHSRPQSRC